MWATRRTIVFDLQVDPLMAIRVESLEDLRDDLRAVYWVGFGNSWGHWHNNHVLQLLCL